MSLTWDAHTHALLVGRQVGPLYSRDAHLCALPKVVQSPRLEKLAVQ